MFLFVSLLLISSASAYTNSTLQQNLTAYYGFENTLNSSTNQFNLTSTKVQYAGGIKGLAFINPNGTENINATTQLNFGTSEYTICQYLQLNTTRTSLIYDKAEGGGFNLISTGGQLRFTHGGCTIGLQYDYLNAFTPFCFKKQNLPDGTHINLSAYANGTRIDSTSPTQCLTANQSNAYPLTIGSFANNSASLLNGTIDEFTIWTRALTDAEIAIYSSNNPASFYPFINDTTPPTYANATVLNAPALQNKTMNFSIQWQDDYNLSQCWSHNTITGLNTSPASCAGVSATTTYAATVNLTPGQVITFTFFANDTSGNLNSTHLNISVISNTSAAPRFNVSSLSWTHTAVSYSVTATREFTLTNLGGNNATNCTFHTIGTLDTHITTPAFSIQNGSTTTLNATIANVSTGIYLETFYASCQDAITNQTITTTDTSTSATIFWAINTPPDTGGGGGGGDTIFIGQENISINPPFVDQNFILWPGKSSDVFTRQSIPSVKIGSCAVDAPFKCKVEQEGTVVTLTRDVIYENLASKTFSTQMTLTSQKTGSVTAVPVRLRVYYVGVPLMLQAGLIVAAGFIIKKIFIG